jgi:hypothetical protein
MKKKLELKKTTLLQLTPTEMRGVHGGTSPLIPISVRVCAMTTDKIAGAATAVATAVGSLLKNAKPADTNNISGRGECTA